MQAVHILSNDLKKSILPLSLSKDLMGQIGLGICHSTPANIAAGPVPSLISGGAHELIEGQRVSLDSACASVIRNTAVG